MVNKSLYRIAGLSSLTSALLYVLSLVVAIFMANTLPLLGFALVLISTLLLLPVLYALYIMHRDEAASLGLLALVATTVGAVGGLFVDPTTLTPLLGLFTLLFAVGAVLFGWLAHRSAQLPRGLGLVAILVGVLGSVMAIVAFSGGSGEVFGLLNLILTVPYIVWFVWLSWHWLRQPAQG